VTERLAGVALVTGGGRGIGRELAVAVAESGMRVAVAGRTTADLEETARRSGALALEADVSREADVAHLVERTENELGPVDLLVNNAGLASWDERAWEEAPSEWWRVVEVNVLGPFLCSRGVLPGMVARRSGRIVNLSSAAAYLPLERGSAYAASKAALARLSEVLARQTERYGISVFAVSPGLVRTDMNRDVFPDDAPWVSPELVVRLVRALASGRLDRLSGRFLHAADDDIEALERSADDIVARDGHAVRLQR
jgi:3-oxoacyl-[acyl-carrier protein] reductase